MNHTNLMQQAQRRVKRKIGFAIHLAVYLLVNAGLAAAHLLGAGHGHWHAGPLLGWGLGLAIHGGVTLLALRGAGLRQRWVASELRMLREQR